MTCIVSWLEKKEDGSTEVWMGADSVGSNDWGVTILNNPKLFRLKVEQDSSGLMEDMLIGFTDSYRMGQLLRYKLELPKHPAEMDAYDYMCIHFVEAARKALKDGGYTQIESNREHSGCFLVGYQDRVFVVESNFAVQEPQDPFASCGAGYMYALGALHTESDVQRTPDARLIRALETASKFSPWVQGPFLVESIR